MARNRWRPWWVVGDRSRVRWNLGLAVGWTVLAVLSVSVGRFSWVTPLNWALLAASNWLLGLVGLVVLKRRPDLAVRPRRPNTTPATICTIAAALAAVGGVIAGEVSIDVIGRIGLGVAWFVVGAAVTAVLGVITHRLNDRAEAHGRLALAADRRQTV